MIDNYQRYVLYNQFEILKLLDQDNSSTYEEKQAILEYGSDSDVEDLYAYFEGTPEDVKKEVFAILEMYFALDITKLPLELPEIDSFLPTEDGEPPLSRAANWKTPEGYPYETSTMPGFAGSSAYYLRYMDPDNNNGYQDTDDHTGEKAAASRSSSLPARVRILFMQLIFSVLFHLISSAITRPCRGALHACSFLI